MDAIEPFDYTELKPFSTAYLPGFMADKYDLDAEACSEKANARIRQSTEDVFASTTSEYTTLELEYADINLTQGRYKVCADACLDAVNQVERSKLPLCHEWADRQAHWRFTHR